MCNHTQQTKQGNCFCVHVDVHICTRICLCTLTCADAYKCMHTYAHRPEAKLRGQNTHEGRLRGECKRNGECERSRLAATHAHNATRICFLCFTERERGREGEITSHFFFFFFSFPCLLLLNSSLHHLLPYSLTDICTHARPTPLHTHTHTPSHASPLQTDQVSLLSGSPHSLSLL